MASLQGYVNDRGGLAKVEGGRISLTSKPNNLERQTIAQNSKVPTTKSGYRPSFRERVSAPQHGLPNPPFGTPLSYQRPEPDYSIEGNGLDDTTLGSENFRDYDTMSVEGPEESFEPPSHAQQEQPGIRSTAADDAYRSSDDEDAADGGDITLQAGQIPAPERPRSVNRSYQLAPQPNERDMAAAAKEWKTTYRRKSMLQQNQNSEQHRSPQKGRTRFQRGDQSPAPYSQSKEMFEGVDEDDMGDQREEYRGKNGRLSLPAQRSPGCNLRNDYQNDMESSQHGLDEDSSDMGESEVPDEDILREPSPSPAGNRTFQQRSSIEQEKGIKRQAPVELDFDEEALSAMQYSQLRDQEFEDNPRANNAAIPQNDSLAADASVQERLQHYATRPTPEQIELLSRMRMNEWEESGDWFIERFTDLMSKLRDARKEKRQIAQQFEDEIAHREEEVRAKIDNLDGVMKDMKNGGEGVLRGKVAF
jgi:hypothetical protein